jgi:superoxide dismutase, Fe-Mn family
MDENLDRLDDGRTGPRSLTRRGLLESAAVAGAGAVLLTGIGGRTAMAESTTESLAPAYRGEHPIEPLPFDPKKLRGLSEKLIVSHHANNYAGAVKRLNQIEKQLGALPRDAAPFQFGSLKREELIASNSMRLHELYFANLGGDGRAEGRAARLLKDAYGSLEGWEHDFRQTALSLGGGSGWVVVAWDRQREALHNHWAWDHAHQAVGGEAVLVFDVYEHAYHMDYGAATKAYVDAFLANVRWDEVERRIPRTAAAKQG